MQHAHSEERHGEQLCSQCVARNNTAEQLSTGDVVPNAVNDLYIRDGLGITAHPHLLFLIALEIIWLFMRRRAV